MIKKVYYTNIFDAGLFIRPKLKSTIHHTKYISIHWYRYKFDCHATRVPEKKKQYGDNHVTTTHWPPPATQTTFHIWVPYFYKIVKIFARFLFNGMLSIHRLQLQWPRKCCWRSPRVIVNNTLIIMAVRDATPRYHKTVHTITWAINVMCCIFYIIFCVYRKV